MNTKFHVMVISKIADTDIQSWGKQNSPLCPPAVHFDRHKKGEKTVCKTNKILNSEIILLVMSISMMKYQNHRSLYSKIVFK